MSIFGNLDTTLVNDNPFYVKPDTYWAVCTDAVIKVSEDNSSTSLVLTWTIDEPDNEYHHKNQQEYFGLFPERNGVWEDYTPEEKTATKWLKRRLRRAFDLSESEVDNVTVSELIGKEAYITLKESKGKEDTKNAGKTFINIADGISKRLYEEEKKGDGSGGVASTLGL
jgi:hypothetical protein